MLKLLNTTVSCYALFPESNQLINLIWVQDLIKLLILEIKYINANFFGIGES